MKGIVTTFSRTNGARNPAANAMTTPSSHELKRDANQLFKSLTLTHDLVGGGVLIMHACMIH